MSKERPMAIRRKVFGPAGWLRSFILVVSCAGLSASLPAQDAPGGKGSAEKGETAERNAANRLKEMKRSAGRYRIEIDDGRAMPLTLVKEPALRWTNPLRITFDGAVFLWVANGRPEVAASFYRKQERGRLREDHEFQSLAAVPLTASYEGRVIWTPQEVGVTLAPIPGAPKPAATPSARLRQMRALALEFRAETKDNTATTPLRLLTQPLYRYEANRADLADGALFAFVFATDPEVLLLIEARLAGDALAWHYGLARMSGRTLQAWHKDRNIWQVSQIAGGSREPYFRVPAPEAPH
jgi:hypothetical protein